MIRPELLRDIGDLANEELLFANQKFPLFHSAHEGYGVLLEEIEEAYEETEELISQIDLVKMTIRKNGLAMDRVNGMEKTAIKAAAEAIQVVAMCRKYRDSLGGAK